MARQSICRAVFWGQPGRDVALASAMEQGGQERLPYGRFESDGDEGSGGSGRG